METNGEVKVPGRAAAAARPALPGDAQSLALGHTRRHANAHLAVLAGDAGAVAAPTGLIHNPTRSETRGTGRSE